jgi:putative DNA primase/helicase
MSRPTFLADEADTFLVDNDEMRGLLNAGYRRDGKVIRLVGDDHEPREFSVFAPAAIAMIGRLPDTLEDRSVGLSLRRKKSNERTTIFRHDRCAELDTAARKIARWAADHRAALAVADPDMGSLFNRVADNWRPLFAIADAAGGDWPKRCRDIAIAAELTHDDQSIAIQLLADIREADLLREDAPGLTSENVIAALVRNPERPWAEWRHGKPISPKGVANLLKRFKIFSVRLFLPNGGEQKGYPRQSLLDAFECYLPPILSSQGPETAAAVGLPEHCYAPVDPPPHRTIAMC